MASSELSNFQKFQQILRKRPLTAVPENNDAEIENPVPADYNAKTEIPVPIADPIPPWSGSEQHQRARIVPFLRQTFRWDEQSQLYVEIREAPDECWTIWETLTLNEAPMAWVQYQKTFDKLGVKATNRLVILADDETLNFLERFLLTDAYEKGFFSRMSRNAIIDEKLFRILFFLYNKIQEKIATTSSEVVRQVLAILTEFLDYTFSDAIEGYRDACRTGQVLFRHAWTLFRPGDIVYERRAVAPFQDLYEQCFSVHSSEDSISEYDGARVLSRTLIEMTYRSGQVNTRGPLMVYTTRYIREYNGVKQITAEDLGIVPCSMMAEEKLNAIETTLLERGRRFLQISALPFSFWNYKGPYTIVHSITGYGTIEESTLSSEGRRWQKHTHENVVIDIATSNMHFKSRFDGEFEDFHWSEHNTKEEKPRAIPSIDFSKDGPTDTLLLTCRGYLPGYMLSSSVFAVGILISELRPPIWAPQPLPSVTASLMPDTAQWRGLVHSFLEGGGGLGAEFEQHQARGSGLVLALEGPKIIARKVADEISGHREKPLVRIHILDNDLVAAKAALRWGAIVFVEVHNVSSDQHPHKVLGLRNYASFYPSVILLSCNTINELENHCEEMIDSVISCGLSSKNEPTALWELAITEQTPGLSTDMFDKRLSEICQFLAQLEIRETRIEKILKTAKRIAVTERSQLSLKHVVAVIRLSVTPDRLSEFESLTRMEMHKLGYNQADPLFFLFRQEMPL